MSARRWSWYGLLVELSKPAVGLVMAMSAVTDSINSAVQGVHADMTAHYNHKLHAQFMHEEVTRDLESLPEV